MMQPSVSANTASVIEPPPELWIPSLKKLQAFGPVFQNKFDWPSLS